MSSFRVLRLNTENFRNISTSQVFEFGENVNLFLGNNGNGKTNLLEAIYLLATKKSFRKNSGYQQFLQINEKENKIIKNVDKSEVYLKSVLKNRETDKKFPFYYQITSESGCFFIDGRVAKKRPSMSVIYINPFDANLFYLLPKIKRDFFDFIFGMLDLEYKRDLLRYISLLKMRNKTILQEQKDQLLEQLVAIDIELAKVIPLINEKRENLLIKLKNIFPNVIKKVFWEEFDLDIVLDSKYKGMGETEVLLLLNKQRDGDVAAKITRYGIHKDNYKITLNGKNSNEFASTGQQKLTYLGLYFSYLFLFEGLYGFYPIILMDDISTELDSEHTNAILNFLNELDAQVFVTTTKEINYSAGMVNTTMRSFRIDNGSVIEYDR